MHTHVYPPPNTLIQIYQHPTLIWSCHKVIIEHVHQMYCMGRGRTWIRIACPHYPCFKFLDVFLDVRMTLTDFDISLLTAGNGHVCIIRPATFLWELFLYVFFSLQSGADFDLIDNVQTILEIITQQETQIFVVLYFWMGKRIKP